jgi:S-adenosyl methyltransferase
MLAEPGKADMSELPEVTSSEEGRTAYIQADLGNPQEILSSPVVRSVLDFSQPVALLLLAVLQFIPMAARIWLGGATGSQAHRFRL